MITEINKQSTQIIRDRAIGLLKQLESEFGVQITPRGGTFSGNNCSLKFEFALKGENGSVMTREAEDFKRYAHIYGLTAEDLGREFVDLDGMKCKVIGFLPRSKRYPFLVQCGAKRAKYGPVALKALLAKGVR